MTKNLLKLKAEAEEKLATAANIFARRDGKTTSDPRVQEFRGRLYCRILLTTTGHPFDKDSDEALLIANLDNLGGFENITCYRNRKRTRLLVTATYGGESSAVVRYGEVTIGELVKFIKEHRADFPLGMNTKISLGDFGGNTYHRKVAVGTDDGRLYLSYEMHERADS